MANRRNVKKGQRSGHSKPEPEPGRRGPVMRHGRAPAPADDRSDADYIWDEV